MAALPPPAGGPRGPSGLVLAGTLIAAAAAVAVEFTLRGTTTASLLVIAAWGVAGFIAGRATAVGLRVVRPAERVKTWAADRQRTTDDEYVASELGWRWRKAAEGAGIGRLVWAPSGPWVTVPLVVGVDLRPPFTRLKVQLRPGQIIDDLIAVQERLRALMGANGIRIRRLAADFVTVELW
jgi:hypothetical protein